MIPEYEPRRRTFLVMFITLAALLFAAIVLGMTAPTLFSGPEAPPEVASA